MASRMARVSNKSLKFRLPCAPTTFLWRTQLSPILGWALASYKHWKVKSPAPPLSSRAKILAHTWQIFITLMTNPTRSHAEGSPPGEVSMNWTNKNTRQPVTHMPSTSLHGFFLFSLGCFDWQCFGIQIQSLFRPINLLPRNSVSLRLADLFMGPLRVRSRIQKQHYQSCPQRITDFSWMNTDTFRHMHFLLFLFISCLTAFLPT